MGIAIKTYGVMGPVETVLNMIEGLTSARLRQAAAAWLAPLDTAETPTRFLKKWQKQIFYLRLETRLVRQSSSQMARLAAVKSRMVPRAMPSMCTFAGPTVAGPLKDTYGDQPHAHKEKGNQHCFFKPSLRHASSKDLSYAKAK